MFVYFKNPSDSNPAGQINMRDSRFVYFFQLFVYFFSGFVYIVCLLFFRVEEVEHISSDSDSDETEIETRIKEPTLGIFPNHVQQVYKNFVFVWIFGDFWHKSGDFHSKRCE